MSLRIRDGIAQRLVLVTGKGGVGKTTVTAAIARSAGGDQLRVPS